MRHASTIEIAIIQTIKLISIVLALLRIYCETQSKELKTVKEIISTASILLAIIIIISFYSCIVLIDIIKYCFKKDNKSNRVFRKQKIERFVYHYN